MDLFIAVTASLTFVCCRQQWMIINTAWDWSTCDRANTIPSSDGAHVNLPPSLLEYIPYDSVGFQRFAAQLSGRPVPPLVGNRHFYCSDYMVHRRSSWVATIHMYSNRTVPSRCVNEQGKESEHVGDAMNYLYYTGHEYVCQLRLMY